MDEVEMLWDKLDQIFFIDNSTESMPERLKECINFKEKD